MNQRLRFRLLLLLCAALSLTSCGGKSAPPTAAGGDTPLWTEEDRKAVVEYWAAPGRYTVESVLDAERINVTVAGSEWYSGYLAALAQQPAEAQTAWQNWLAQRISAEKAALTAALTAPPSGNAELVPGAGTMPEAMKARLPEPPALFEKARPLRYRIAFASSDYSAPITYVDNINFAERKPYYAYYRSTNGVIQPGKRIKDFTGEERKKLDQLLKSAGQTESEARIVLAVSALEGGFEAINTYDTGFVSIGFIQFITGREGNGSLGAVLARYKQDDFVGFRNDFHRFGIEVTPEKTVAAIDPTTGVERRGADAVRAIIDDKRLTAVFERAGKGEGFRKAQLILARERYWPGEDSIIAIVNGVQQSARVAEIIRSEAGMATLMDRKVNRGNIRLLNEVAVQLITRYKLNRLEDLTRYEREIIQAMKFRRDFLADPTLSQPPAAAGGTGSGVAPAKKK